MDSAQRRVHAAHRDACGHEDKSDDGLPFSFYEDEDLASPLDSETLDEQHSSQMGKSWESRRRDDDD